MRVLASCGLISLLLPAIASAQPGLDKDPISWDRNVHSLFSRHCYSCHGGDKPAGDLNLSTDVDPLMIQRNRIAWETVLTVLHDESMPPDDAKRKLADKDRELMIRFLDKTLGELDCQSPGDPGRPILRRLNRSEYDLAILDLTGLDLGLGTTFPPDSEAFGFDNIGDALSMSPMQVEQYHDAAKTIVAAILAARDEPDNKPYERVFFVAPGKGITDAKAAKKIVERFASLAFRRPIDSALLGSLVKAYDSARECGADHQTAVGYLLTGILVSPRFLMRIESDQEDASGPYRVDDFELASRLSFFLWSRPPDEYLRQLASAGKLQDDKTLRQQTQRMLADVRSDALVDHFFAQWLGFESLDTYQPDPQTFPQFNEELRQSMLGEVRRVLGAIVRQNRPITEIVDAGYTYLDETLAKHYDLFDAYKQSNGDSSFVRVKLADRNRGGLLTSAAILMLQSDPTRTNIPRRGNFIAGQILGTAPPPPPADVPPLPESNDNGKQQTLRETFEQHRVAPGCAACHAKIDPLGFSLENFDAIGRWRTTDAGLPIDASAELPGSPDFVGPTGLKDTLLLRQNEIVETIVRRLLVYALGRGLEPGDECLVRDVFADAEKHDFHFAEIVASIVLSDTFRLRRNAEF